jgi:hypothetical protein
VAWVSNLRVGSLNKVTRTDRQIAPPPIASPDGPLHIGYIALRKAPCLERDAACVFAIISS